MTKLNENRPGYKKTKIGWIPEEWVAIKLGLYVDIISGNSPAVYKPSNSGNYPFVKVDDMNLCSIHQTHARLYTSISKSLIPKGAILFAKRGEAIVINKVRMAQRPLVMDSNMMALVPNDSIDSMYLYYTILEQKLWRIADTSTIPQINNKHITPYKIPLPPLPEQKKIAEILSVWDRAIEQVGKLIEAKTKLKKALTQQLLTGRKRVKEFGKPINKKSEFPEGWEDKSLGEFGSFLKGKGISNSEKKGTGLPCITYGEIYTKYNFIIKEFHSFVNAETARISQRIKNNDILFAGSGETLDEIGKCVAFTKDIEAYAGGDIVIFRPDKGDSNYLSYVLNSDFIIRQRRKLGQGHSVVHIYSSGLKTLKIPLPSLPEQRKIAEIFTTCDQEIELFNKKRERLQEEKKGLMQKLLTGNIRVKTDQWIKRNR